MEWWTWFLIGIALVGMCVYFFMLTIIHAMGMPDEFREQIKKEAEAKNMCGRCYGEGLPVFPANCDEKPELLKGQPIGQYHCPDCGAMILAGIPHPPLCKLCLDRMHPGIDS